MGVVSEPVIAAAQVGGPGIPRMQALVGVTGLLQLTRYGLVGSSAPFADSREGERTCSGLVELLDEASQERRARARPDQPNW